MNGKYVFAILCFCLLVIAIVPGTYSWGFWGHRRINGMAVFLLPSDMIGFYKKHIDYLTDNSVSPDKRRYVLPEEAARHYIDLDHYGEHPYRDLPRKWEAAVAKYSEDSLRAHGIVPWHIDYMLHALTNAFKEKNAKKILRLSADIGHYIADAHVPLHTTVNYNGQLTNQQGIHAFWESRLPELFGDDYNYFIGKAAYLEKPLDKIWETVLESNRAVDSVLSTEKKLKDSFPSDKIYVYANKGSSAVRLPSEEFSRAYDEKLNRMVEQRMRQAILEVASYWLTAWVNAGKPDLRNLKEEQLSEEEQRLLEEEEKLYRRRKIIGREHQD